MADGDFDIRTRFRSELPGTGWTSSGGAVQNKTLVIGDCDFTYNTGGLVIAPADVSLSVIDFIIVTQVQANNDTAPTATTPFSGVYNAAADGTGNVILTTNASTQAEADDSGTGTFSFLAFGDSGSTPNLT